MKHHLWKSYALILAALGAFWGLARPATAQTYSVTDLGDLPGNIGFTQATALNNAGQIIGTGISTMTFDPFLWTPATPNGLTGTVQDFGAGSFANAVNASGLVVGNAGTSSADDHPFVLRDGALVNLNGLIPGNLGVNLTNAVGINDAGQIIANGSIPGGVHAFLLTPMAGPVLPSAPKNVFAVAGNASVTITWSASLQATSYHVKRAFSNAEPFATIATVAAPTTQFVDLTVKNGVGYYYLVTAVNSVGESPNSLLTFAFPLPNPTNLTATGGHGQIVLNWKPPAGITVLSYTVYRAVGNGPFSPIAAIFPARTTFTDKQVVAGLTYTYRVTADAKNFGSRETPPSNTASATPQ